MAVSARPNPVRQISATALTRAIWAKPITGQTIIHRLDNGKFEIKSLSLIRSVGTITVCLIRLGIAYVMLCCGTFFLACAPCIAPSARPCVAEQLYALACPPRSFSRALSMVRRLVAPYRALADTIEISRLLLQTVVLGFVMLIDELVYTSLAPLHVKKTLNETVAFVTIAMSEPATRPSRDFASDSASCTLTV